MKLYAYCLTEGLDSVPESLRGIGHARVRLARAQDFSVLLSDFPGDTITVNRDNALAHAAVVRSVLGETTPLPFRFGSLVTEQQLENYVRARSEALKSKFDLVRGCVEMSVKIIWDREWTEEPRREESGKPGTAFLAEKRRELIGSEARAEEATTIAGWLEDRLGDVVRDKAFKTDFKSRLLVTAALLVERRLIEPYKTRLKNARLERPELHFLASGPWPPYSFANLDLEFKTRFGVS